MASHKAHPGQNEQVDNTLENDDHKVCICQKCNAHETEGRKKPTENRTKARHTLLPERQGKRAAT